MATVLNLYSVGYGGVYCSQVATQLRNTANPLQQTISGVEQIGCQYTQ